MEGGTVAPPLEAGVGTYVGWKELFVSTEKGRREVHYCLIRKDGSSDLAVVGKEKNFRHMTYHYAIQNRVLLDLAPSSALLKLRLRSRREVVDLMNSIVRDSSSHVSSQTIGDNSIDRGVHVLDVETMKDTGFQKLGHRTNELLWLGSPWTCTKKWKHYQSFYRYGIKISVNDFVYVLAEEDTRLVAYLDDMYEDSRGNNMVVVQWFHKIDEVGIDLPHNFNDREIFFSLSHQELSIECIDGFATVLSPQHFDKFLNEATHTQLEPFMCHRQYDNGELKPFDITRVKGYWKQDILRYMYTAFPSNDLVNFHMPDASLKLLVQNKFSKCGSATGKQFCLSRRFKVDPLPASRRDNEGAHLNGQTNIASLAGCKNGGSDAYLSSKEVNMEIPPPHLAVDSTVEVLSQDSGMRGCWFRVVIIKRHKNKLKVRYQDVQDADDEAKNLEEWVLAARIAARDKLGLRIDGRTTIRPSPKSHNARVSWAIDVGAVVDAWWHDAWWEGIVIGKESDEKLRIYFPGEKRESFFHYGDLRRSQEWLDNTWKDLKGRPDVAASILSDLETEQQAHEASDNKQGKASMSSKQQLKIDASKDGSSGADSDILCMNDKETDPEAPDLSKDYFLSQLRWKSSRKRRRGGDWAQKLQYGRNISRSPEKLVVHSPLKLDSECCKSFKVDCENCKSVGESLFNSSVVPTSLTSLVMSR
ncbi:hypothetical protein Nepgr_028063 [Nepenthes gracilis]|uniref:BAH domain-containing protein n=1 Tax=Nepenthes gracilis TaxID=150966 RepID=A0AAD3Y3K3_NEPGR|nr:hypothetical protein Nepgr_028063 [Nepenthes gracilis]